MNSSAQFKTIKSNEKVVILDSLMAKKVIKTIELGKMHKEQLDLCQDASKIKDKIIENQKGIIDTHVQQTTNYKLAVEEQDKTIILQNSILNNKEKTIRKEKTKTSFWKVISGLLAGLVGYLVIGK